MAGCILSAMRRARRVIAICLSVLLANVVWVGSGFACVMPAMMSSSASAAAVSDDAGDMAGMVMPNAATPPRHTSQQEHDAPCRYPWAPDGCQSMVPCAPASLASHIVLLSAPNGPQPRPARLVVLTPPSVIRTPHRPRPRA